MNTTTSSKRSIFHGQRSHWWDLLFHLFASTRLSLFLILLFLQGNSQGKMQKDGTLGANRAKDDYLLQSFQNGKLIMINIPLPDDRGKGTCEFLTGSTFLTVFLLLCKLKNKLYIHKEINLWRAPIVNTKSQCVQQRTLKELLIIHYLYPGGGK